MAAPEETGEYGTNAAAQPGLFPGQPHRFPLHLVEGPGDLADLPGGQHIDRCHGERPPGVPGHAEPRRPRGQRLPGDIRGSHVKPSQRARHSPGHDHGGQQDEGQDGQRRAAGDCRGPHRASLQGLGVGRDPGRQLLLGLAHPADRGGHAGLPLLAGVGAEGQRAIAARCRALLHRPGLRGSGPARVPVRAELSSGVAEPRNEARSLACCAWALTSAVTAPGPKWPAASAAPRMACCSEAWSCILDSEPSARTLAMSAELPLRSAMPSLTGSRPAVAAE